MTPPRGELRVYLGAAPGVGKTYAMLGEGHRRKGRGTDVVIGLVETHGRARTRAMIGDLQVVPRKAIAYREAVFEEMDVDAVLARHPQVALIDELAHTNVPGSRNEKRWQDVEELLAAGITVITTLNIQHLESLNDVVATITGASQRETVPDAMVRAAEQVELVDMTAEALRRRMAHGHIYGPDKVDAALANYFRLGNLTALRELALLWLADKVDDQLERYRAEHAIAGVWETHERVVVALTGGPEGEALIRRGARIAARTRGDLLAVHVAGGDGLTVASPAALAGQRQLAESLGGSFHQVLGESVPHALIEFARRENATQLVLGASRRPALARLLTGPGVGATVVRLSGDIDVHIVSHRGAEHGRLLPQLPHGLAPRRRLQGSVLAAILLPLVTLVLAQLRSDLNLTDDVLIYLLAVVAAAVVGGGYPGVASAVIGSLLLNFYFTPPLHRFTIAQRNNIIALVAFVVVAVVVASVVEFAARRSTLATRAAAESQTLATVAGSILRGQAALPSLLGQVREALSLASLTLVERAGTSGAWVPVAFSGEPVSAAPDDGDFSVAAGERVTLVARGRPPHAEDQRLLAVFAVQAAIALEQQRLAEAAQAAKPLAEADKMRTALLAAVSHDLRSPLSSATAAVDSLSSPTVEWTPGERAELLATARESLQRLTRLVENLLDMSRLQAGALSVFPEAVRLDDVVPRALDTLGPQAGAVGIELPQSLPEAIADPELLERVIANVAANALRFAPPGVPPQLCGSAYLGFVELRVIDTGPGIRPEDRERVFIPFQRLGDTDNTTGTGLGLALARGLTEAMGGQLIPEDTPGGGLTMVVRLKQAPEPNADPAAGEANRS